ncbi:MAG: hypothetical protein HYZ14_17030 [Bacteroidetes bacterium]|nr:hypothetical protein [Bacteroidota bacterium]
MKKAYALFAVLFLFFSLSKSYATTVTATQNGNWNQTDTWSPATVPGCFDTIVIPAGITVTITVTVNLTACPPVYILVEGTLTFQTGKKLDLPDGSVVYIAPGGSLTGGGGGGSSNWITIAGSPYWTAGDGNLTGPAILCQSCSLPIELVNFTADLNDGVVLLQWQTASEEENDYFWVQRSTDGFTWENLAMVDGAGNSSVLIDYAAEDRNPQLGMSYYRLKQVDMNGSFSYSPTRVISNGDFYSDQQLLVLSSSSEAQHNVVIYFAEPIKGDVEILIVGVTGAVLYSEKLMADSEMWVAITLDRPVSAGIYAIRANQTIEKVFFQ